MSTTESLFSEEEQAALKIDRKRFLAQAYITTGIPLPTLPEGSSRQTSSETVTTTQVEQTTAVAEVTLQQCCPAHGQGCTADHGATLYGTTYTRRSGKLVQLPLIEDSGSQRNWIPRALAKQLQCEISDTGKPGTYLDFGGTKHIVKKKVAIEFDGLGDNTEPVEFHVPPDGFPISCAILGRDFIEKNGAHPNQFFPTKPDMVGIIVQAPVTVSDIIQEPINNEVLS
jgi:hypothetical protein